MLDIRVIVTKHIFSSEFPANIHPKMGHFVSENHDRLQTTDRHFLDLSETCLYMVHFVLRISKEAKKYMSFVKIFIISFTFQANTFMRFCRHLMEKYKCF